MPRYTVVTQKPSAVTFDMGKPSQVAWSVVANSVFVPQSTKYATAKNMLTVLSRRTEASKNSVGGPVALAHDAFKA